jgi:transcriptional regulator with XRE-family HTH domain
MSSLYERIDSLCKSNGINVTVMCKELKIARSSLSELKAGRTKSLSSEYLQRIADRFNVSVDYLLTGEKQKENTPPKKGVRISVLGHVAAGVPIEAINAIFFLKCSEVVRVDFFTDRGSV